MSSKASSENFVNMNDAHCQLLAEQVELAAQLDKLRTYFANRIAVGSAKVGDRFKDRMQPAQ